MAPKLRSLMSLALATLSRASAVEQIKHTDTSANVSAAPQLAPLPVQHPDTPLPFPVRKAGDGAPDSTPPPPPANDADAAGQCETWAADGECIRNPQYMFTHCHKTCDDQSYVDVDAECVRWSADGECEKNPNFMLERCNHSCIVAARRSYEDMLNTPRAQRPNDAYVGATTPQRLHAFLPVFGLVSVILMVGAAVEWMGVLDPLWSSFARAAALPDSNTVGRLLICSYFLNEGVAVLQTSPILSHLLFGALESDGLWTSHRMFVDASNLLGCGGGALAALNVFPLTGALLMLGDILVDSFMLFDKVAHHYMAGKGLVINELMLKKFAMLGCVATLLAVIVSARTVKKTSFPGLLMERAQHVSPRIHFALLCGRLLMASLFLYVGFTELHRLYFEPFTQYLKGDGHDVIWPKAVELLLSVPFALGWRIGTVSRWLALSLVIEAVYAWSWWTELPGEEASTHFAQHRRQFHYREHFMTNIATAGGLLLLIKLKGGRFTMDSVFRKAE